MANEPRKTKPADRAHPADRFAETIISTQTLPLHLVSVNPNPPGPLLRPAEGTVHQRPVQRQAVAHPRGLTVRMQPASPYPLALAGAPHSELLAQVHSGLSLARDAPGALAGLRSVDHLSHRSPLGGLARQRREHPGTRLG